MYLLADPGHGLTTPYIFLETFSRILVVKVDLTQQAEHDQENVS